MCLVKPAHLSLQQHTEKARPKKCPKEQKKVQVLNKV